MACYTCKDMNDFASKARFKIDIQSQVRTDDGYGGSTVTWSSDGKVWAYMTPYRGSKEVFAQQQLQSQLFYSIFIRYKPDYANTRDFSSKRIVYNNRVFNIAFIRSFDEAMKLEGKVYQEIFACENANEVATV